MPVVVGPAGITGLLYVEPLQLFAAADCSTYLTLLISYTLDRQFPNPSQIAYTNDFITLMCL